MDFGQIPNRFRISGNQEPNEHNSKLILSDIVKHLNIGGIVAIILFGFVMLIAIAVIRDLSGWGSGFGFSVMHWFEVASINPQNKRGFACFLKLLMTAGFIGLLIKIFRGR